MKSKPEELYVKIIVGLKFKVSLWDAIKMRIAGVKTPSEFYADLMQKAHKKGSK